MIQPQLDLKVKNGVFVSRKKATSVSVRVSIAVNRHHSNFYRGKPFNWGGLQFRVLVLIIMAGHGGGEGA